MLWEGQHGSGRPDGHGEGGRIVAAGHGSDSGVDTCVRGHADCSRQGRGVGAPRVRDLPTAGPLGRGFGRSTGVHQFMRHARQRGGAHARTPRVCRPTRGAGGTRGGAQRPASTRRDTCCEETVRSRVPQPGCKRRAGAGRSRAFLEGPSPFWLRGTSTSSCAIGDGQ